MKQYLLLFAIALMAVAANAQTAKPVRQQSPGFFLDRAPSLQVPIAAAPHQVAKKHAGTRSINAILIGSASNAFTTLQSENNVVDADNNLNTVVFIHRNDISLYGLTNSQFRYAASTNRGQTFSLNHGPLNPSADGLVGGVNARYPQVSIYNPAGNTDTTNAWLSYIGAWHNGASGTLVNPWMGITYGVMKLNHDIATATEHVDTTDNGNVDIATSMVQGKPGEFWAVDRELGNGSNEGFNDSMLIVYKGVKTGNDTHWQVFTKLNPHFYVAHGGSDTTFQLTPLVSFDKSGKYGWIASAADFNGNGAFAPYFYQSSDSGATWTGPTVVDLTQYPAVMNMLDVTTQDANGVVIGTDVPMIGFELDLGVDKNGDPHLVGVISSAQSHALQTGLSLNLYDVNYSHASGNWDATHIDTLVAFRGALGATSTGAATYTQDNRPQVSVSPDGSKVAFIWSDSPQNPTDNVLPDLMGAALNVDTHLWTPVDTFTNNDPTWGGLATFPSVSPRSFADASSITVPVVITKLNTSNNAEDPATFYYFNDISFSNSDYTVNHTYAGVHAVVKNDASFQLVPNPASSQLRVIGLKPGTSEVRVVNALGQTVQSSRSVNNSIFTTDISALPIGFYTLLVNNNGTVSSKTFVIQR